ncbi:unnamed protein product, partial [Effrenium voratum]
MKSPPLGQFLFCGELGGPQEVNLPKKVLPSLQSLERQLQELEHNLRIRQVRSTPQLRVPSLPALKPKAPVFPGKEAPKEAPKAKLPALRAQPSRGVPEQPEVRRSARPRQEGRPAPAVPKASPELKKRERRQAEKQKEKEVGLQEVFKLLESVNRKAEPVKSNRKSKEPKKALESAQTPIQAQKVLDEVPPIADPSNEAELIKSDATSSEEPKKALEASPSEGAPTSEAEPVEPDLAEAAEAAEEPKKALEESAQTPVEAGVDLRRASAEASPSEGAPTSEAEPVEPDLAEAAEAAEEPKKALEESAQAPVEASPSEGAPTSEEPKKVLEESGQTLVEASPGEGIATADEASPSIAITPPDSYQDEDFYSESFASFSEHFEAAEDSAAEESYATPSEGTGEVSVATPVSARSSESSR